MPKFHDMKIMYMYFLHDDSGKVRENGSTTNREQAQTLQFNYYCASSNALETSE